MLKKLKLFTFILLSTALLASNSFALNVVELAPQYFGNPGSSRALSNAKVYVGEVDLDPEIQINQKQISVLQENGSTVQVSQPLSTSAGGYPLYNGSPITIMVDGDYSLKIVSSTGTQYYYVPENTNLSGDNSENITILQGVPNIAALRLFSGAKDGDRTTVDGYHVIADGGGNDFYWDASSIAADDGINIIKVSSVDTGRWMVIRSIPLTAKMSGMKGDDITNDSAAFLAGVATLENGTRFVIPTGEYRLNVLLNDYELQGQGSSTILKPFNAVSEDGFALRLGRHSVPYGDWDFYKISDLTFDAVDTPGAGCVTMNDDGGIPELAGRWIFDNITFRGGVPGANTYGLQKQSGNIGNSLTNAHFSRLDFGYHATDSSGGIMHVGADRLERCQFQEMELAAFYLKDSTDGYGQTTLTDCLFESNPGFGVFVDGLGSIVNSPPFELRNVWFENNATSASVTIDSVAYTPRDIRLNNAKNVVIAGSYLKDVDLAGDTDVVARDCRIDASSGAYHMVKEDASSLQLYNPSGFFCKLVDEWSHTAPAAIGPYVTGEAMSLRMAHRSVKSQATSRTSLAYAYEGAAHTFVGSNTVSTTTVLGGGLLYDDCSQLIIPANAQIFDGTIGATIPAGAMWVVSTIAVKVISGADEIFDAYIWDGLASNQLNAIRIGAVDEWVTTVAMIDMRSAGEIVGLAPAFRTLGGGSATIQIADFQIAYFSTKQQATDFIHSGIYEYTP